MRPFLLDVNTYIHITVWFQLLEQIQKNRDENAYKPPWRENAREHGGGRFKQKTTEETLGIFQSVLPRITPERFAGLMQQVKYLNINTEDRLKGAIELILEQAVSEPGFCATYARMCRELAGVSYSHPSRTSTCDGNTSPVHLHHSKYTLYRGKIRLIVLHRS